MLGFYKGTVEVDAPVDVLRCFALAALLAYCRVFWDGDGTLFSLFPISTLFNIPTRYVSQSSRYSISHLSLTLHDSQHRLK